MRICGIGSGDKCGLTWVSIRFPFEQMISGNGDLVFFYDFANLLDAFGVSN